MDKKNFMVPFYGWSSTASKRQSHYEEAVYFLPISSQGSTVSVQLDRVQLSQGCRAITRRQLSFNHMSYWHSFAFTGAMTDG